MGKTYSSVEDMVADLIDGRPAIEIITELAKQKDEHIRLLKAALEAAANNINYVTQCFNIVADSHDELRPCEETKRYDAALAALKAFEKGE